MFVLLNAFALYLLFVFVLLLCNDIYFALLHSFKMLIFVLFVCLQEQQGVEYIYAPTHARTVHIYM